MNDIIVYHGLIISLSLIFLSFVAAFCFTAKICKKDGRLQVRRDNMLSFTIIIASTIAFSVASNIVFFCDNSYSWIKEYPLIAKIIIYPLVGIIVAMMHLVVSLGATVIGSVLASRLLGLKIRSINDAVTVRRKRASSFIARERDYTVQAIEIINEWVE